MALCDVAPCDMALCDMAAVANASLEGQVVADRRKHQHRQRDP